MIIPYRRGCLQAGINIRFVDNVSLLRTVRPDPGKTVGLKFKVNGVLITLARILPL